MSHKIDKAAAAISRTKLADLTKARNLPQPADSKSPTDAAAKATPESPQNSSLRSILTEFAAGSEQHDDKSFKSFTHLARSLEKYFSAADAVDRQTGDKELKQGGLRRIAKDLRKLFKGLGIPSQTAKQLSGAIATAIGQKGVEQISVSLATSSQTQLEAQQTKATYLADGTGRAIASVERNSFQLSVIRSRSLDISLNLRTGEFSLSQTTAESMSLKLESSSALASFFPLEEDTAGAAAIPMTDPEEISALVGSDSNLQQISNLIKQSPLAQLEVKNGKEKQETETEARFDATLDSLQQLVSELGELTAQSGSIFESLLQISNLRTERKEETNHLLFTLAAQAPVGLTAIDATGHGKTLYPRPDGSVGKRVETDVKVTS